MRWQRLRSLSRAIRLTAFDRSRPTPYAAPDIWLRARTGANRKIQTRDGIFYGIDAVGDIAAVHPASTGWRRADTSAQL